LKQIGTLNDTIKTLTTAKERSDLKAQKSDNDFKEIQKNLEKESKSKWDLEQQKTTLTREVADTQKIVKENQLEISRLRERATKLEGKLQLAQDSALYSEQNLINVKRDLEKTQKKATEELEDVKRKSERRITALEQDIQFSKTSLNSIEKSSSDVFVENKKNATRN